MFDDVMTFASMKIFFIFNGLYFNTLGFAASQSAPPTSGTLNPEDLPKVRQF